MARDLKSVEHQHQQVELVQAAGQKAAQLLGHACDQVTARRALARTARGDSRRRRIEVFAATARRDAEQDLIEHLDRYRVTGAELLEARKLRLTTGGATQARTTQP